MIVSNDIVHREHHCTWVREYTRKYTQTNIHTNMHTDTQAHARPQTHAQKSKIIHIGHLQTYLRRHRWHLSRQGRQHQSLRCLVSLQRIEHLWRQPEDSANSASRRSGRTCAETGLCPHTPRTPEDEVRNRSRRLHRQRSSWSPEQQGWPSSFVSAIPYGLSSLSFPDVLSSEDHLGWRRSPSWSHCHQHPSTRADRQTYCARVLAYGTHLAAHAHAWCCQRDARRRAAWWRLWGRHRALSS